MSVPITIRGVLSAIGGTLYKSDKADLDILLPILDSSVLSISLDEAFNLYLGGFYKESSDIERRVVRVLMFISYNLLKWEEYKRLNGPCIDCSYSESVLNSINNKYNVEELLKCIECKGFDKSRLDRFAKSLVPILPSKPKQPLTVGVSGVGSACIAKPDGTSDCNCTRVPINCEKEEIMLCNHRYATVDFELPIGALGNRVIISRVLPISTSMPDVIEFNIPLNSEFNGATALNEYINSLNSPYVRSTVQDYVVTLYYDKLPILADYSSHNALCSSSVKLSIKFIQHVDSKQFDCCLPLCASCCEEVYTYYATPSPIPANCSSICPAGTQYVLDLDAIDCSECEECCGEGCDWNYICSLNGTYSGVKPMACFAYLTNISISGDIYGGHINSTNVSTVYTPANITAATLELIDVYRGTPVNSMCYNLRNYSTLCYTTDYRILYGVWDNDIYRVKVMCTRLLPRIECGHTMYVISYIDELGNVNYKTYSGKGKFDMYPTVSWLNGVISVVFPTTLITENFTGCPEQVTCDSAETVTITKLFAINSICCLDKVVNRVSIANVHPDIEVTSHGTNISLIPTTLNPTPHAILSLQDTNIELDITIRKCKVYKSKLFDLVWEVQCDPDPLVGIDKIITPVYAKYSPVACPNPYTTLSCPECVGTMPCPDCPTCPDCPPFSCLQCSSCCNSNTGCDIDLNYVYTTLSCNTGLSLTLSSSTVLNSNIYYINVLSPTGVLLAGPVIVNSPIAPIVIDIPQVFDYYTVNITEEDPNGVLRSCTFIITPSIPSLTVPLCEATIVNNDCNQTTSGSITLRTTAVITNVDWYKFDGNDWVLQLTHDRSVTNLESGSYRAVITYGNGCTGECLFEVTGINSPIITVQTPQSLCTTNGNVILSIEGGVRDCLECQQGLWVSIDNGEYIQLDSTNLYILNNLTVGQHLIKVKDCSCCITTKVITISQSTIR